MASPSHPKFPPDPPPTGPLRQKKPGAHHHGDLRRALIEAGLALVAEAGVEALSVRKVAARAGVSHAAPAHHFKHLADLRAAIAAEGYRQFTRAMQHEMRLAEPSPQAQILAAGRGYITFARENPSMFHLMFSGPAYEFVSAELEQAAAESYDVLRQISAPLEPGPTGELGNEMLVWSIVHGFSSLLVSQPGNKEFQENAMTLFEGFFPALPLREET